MLENSLFRVVKLTKHTGVNNYRYSGYGIGFDRHGSFSYPGIGVDRNKIIFGVNMSWSTGKKIFWFWVKTQHKC